MAKSELESMWDSYYIQSDDFTEKKFIFVGTLPDASTAMRNCIYLAVIESKILKTSEMHGYLVMDGAWADLGVFDSSDFEHEEPKETPTNCKNCGAPLENGKCKYCGTEY